MNSQALIAMSLKRSIEFEENGFYLFDFPADVDWEFSINFFYRPIIPSLSNTDSRDSQTPTNLNRWRKQEVCDGFSDFVAIGL